MINTQNTTGIILAGGKSKRMGRDKGFILWKDKPFVLHIAEQLKKYCDEIIIVANDEKYQSLPYKVVADIVPDQGPVGGIHTALSHSKTTFNLLLSCDIPLVNEKLLSLLIKHSCHEFQLTQLATQENQMPLIGMYNKSSLVHFENALKQDERRLRKVCAQLTQQTILVNKPLEALTHNFNTPEDLKFIEYVNQD